MIERVLVFSVHRRWLVVLMTVAVAALGIWSADRLAVDAVPDITNNQVQINTLAPALTPQDVEKQVTYPVESALAGIPGLEYTRSLSRNGFSQVTAVFGERVDIYFARAQVNERLAEAKTILPPGAEVRMSPISTGLGEVYMWTVEFTEPNGAGDATGRGFARPGPQSDGSFLTSEGHRLTTETERSAYLREVQDWIIRPQIRTVPGVAGVDAIGGLTKQYQVQPDPAKLIGLGLSFADLGDAIERNNLSRGAGYLERNGEGLVVRSGGRLESMAEIGDVVVTTRGGVPVRVKDVATVSVGREIRTGSASENGREVVVGTALMLIGANSRTVAAAIDARMKEIRHSLPAGIEVRTALNRTLLVDATIATVTRNLSEGALLVVLVLFLLLGNIRAALVTAAVIPVTMLLTATAMVQGRISANLMSLGALDFGLIVDGAVIIAENSLRRLAERRHALGRPLTHGERLSTVAESAHEMIKPSVYGQAIIMLVYLPLLTFTGVEGKMFQPMAATVLIALAAAFVLSLTFVPAMIAITITRDVSEKENPAIAVPKRFYRPLLIRSVRSPSGIVAASVVLFAVAAVLFPRLGQEFMPTLDEKNIAMHAMRIPSTALRQSQDMQFRVEKAISAFPEVALVFSKTGTAEVAMDPMPPNVSDTFIILKPQSEWPDPSLPKDELVARIQGAIGTLPGNNFEFTQPIQMRFNELLAGTRGDLAVKFFGVEFDTLLPPANRVAAVLRAVPGAQDVRVEQVSGLPVLEIAVDKGAIARLGLSRSAVQEVIGAAIGGRDAGVLFEGDRRFPIVVRLADAVREDVETLKNIPVPLPATTSGPPAVVLLKQVATFSFSEGPNQISRENGKRRIVVTANVRGRDIASLVAEAQHKVRTQVRLPAGAWITWGGQFENLAAARARLAIVVPACFFLVFLLLHSALGSARDALLVFSAVPLALTGGVLALWLRGMPFSVSAAVGFIALSGVAVLNGLVMLTRIKQSIADGRRHRAAILDGAMTRLRPIVMTALVASLGFVPMAIATGTGAEVQKPIATIVIGGLISATLLTLIVLPALYARFGAPRQKPSSDAATLEPTIAGLGEPAK